MRDFYTVQPLAKEIENKITRRAYSAKLDIQEGERAVIFTINTDKVGRDDLVILPKGAQLDAFKKNPRVMWAHNYDTLPIARAEWVRVIDGELRAKAIFAEEELNAVADQVYRMLIAKPPFLEAASIGFDILEQRAPTKKELDEHPDWPRLGEQGRGILDEMLGPRDEYVVSKWELLEFSVVPIPADIGALALAVSRGMAVPKQVLDVLTRAEKKYTCECIECGHTLETDEHCKDLKCPDCGGQMRRKDRPGPGQKAQDNESTVDAMRPYPNEHSCRLEDPGQFDKFRRENCGQKHDDKCIDVIYGIKAGKSKIQALRYKTKIWEAGVARSHCKSREGTFEEAGESKQKGLQDALNSMFTELTDAQLDKADIQARCEKMNIERSRKIRALHSKFKHVTTLEGRIRKFEKENQSIRRQMAEWIDRQLGKI